MTLPYNIIKKKGKLDVVCPYQVPHSLVSASTCDFSFTCYSSPPRLASLPHLTENTDPFGASGVLAQRQCVTARESSLKGILMGGGVVPFLTHFHSPRKNDERVNFVKARLIPLLGKRACTDQESPLLPLAPLGRGEWRS